MKRPGPKVRAVRVTGQGPTDYLIPAGHVCAISTGIGPTIFLAGGHQITTVSSSLNSQQLAEALGWRVDGDEQEDQ